MSMSRDSVDLGEVEIPDATTQPAAYVKALVEVLGDRDPLEVLAGTPSEVDRIIASADAQALTSADAGAWSFRDVLGHLLDVDIVYGHSVGKSAVRLDSGAIPATVHRFGRADGRPLSAEVGLGFVDDSVYAIQSDFAGDPRQFFFGTKRSASVQTMASVQQRPYAKFIIEDGKVVDERMPGQTADEERKKNERFVCWA